jgi:hypothetical protein
VKLLSWRSKAEGVEWKQHNEGVIEYHVIVSGDRKTYHRAIFSVQNAFRGMRHVVLGGYFQPCPDPAGGGVEETKGEKDSEVVERS